MKLTVVSHKRVWKEVGKSNHLSNGGFPFQMASLSTLFDHTTLVVTQSDEAAPAGGQSIAGNQIQVRCLPEPRGIGLRRKIGLITWLPRHLPVIWQEIKVADAVHAPVPGDVGTTGILVALAQRKPLFVRHCGTWGNRTTFADRFLDWILPRIAGGRNVVLATGGGNDPPSAKNPNIHWIFSTSLSEEKIASLSKPQPWEPGHILRLVTVGRLTPEKNAAAIIRAIPILIHRTKKTDNLAQSIAPEGDEALFKSITLDIVGDGKARTSLELLATELGVTETVTFHGDVTHEKVLQILAQAHIFVFPTRVKEGFPKAVLEALACGLPVIASNVSVIPHLIRDCGLVLPEASPEAIADAVLSLIEKPALMRSFATNAQYIARKYTLERWRDEIGAQLEAAWGHL